MKKKKHLRKLYVYDPRKRKAVVVYEDRWGNWYKSYSDAEIAGAVFFKTKPKQ